MLGCVSCHRRERAPGDSVWRHQQAGQALEDGGLGPVTNVGSNDCGRSRRSINSDEDARRSPVEESSEAIMTHSICSRTHVASVSMLANGQTFRPIPHIYRSSSTANFPFFVSLTPSTTSRPRPAHETMSPTFSCCVALPGLQLTLRGSRALCTHTQCTHCRTTPGLAGTSQLCNEMLWDVMTQPQSWRIPPDVARPDEVQQLRPRHAEPGAGDGVEPHAGLHAGHAVGPGLPHPQAVEGDAPRRDRHRSHLRGQSVCLGRGWGA